jgi:ABC-type phosphate transport system substrate-binding protein
MMREARAETRIILLCMALMSLCVSAHAASAELIVIANEDVAASELDSGTLQAIFLGKKTQWENGASIVPVNLKKGSTHQEFLKVIVRRTPAQYRSFWKRAIFTGTGMPPKSFATEEEVVNFVSASPGAIGYIDSSTAHEGVKVLSTK